jgi:hypothetical protein
MLLQMHFRNLLQSFDIGVRERLSRADEVEAFCSTVQRLIQAASAPDPEPRMHGNRPAAAPR